MNSTQTARISPRPDLTDKFSALDGIAIPSDAGESRLPTKREIRSDIEELFSLSDLEFNEWYTLRRVATAGLLSTYELFASIPNLGYGSEGQKYNMSSYVHVEETLNYLKESLDFLEKIKERRAEYRAGQ